MSHTNGRRSPGGQDGAPTVPGRILTQYLAGAILLLVVAALLTQTLAITTGKDFAFGLIPKFNPSGSRNIPVWFASAVFALGAAFAAVMALARRPAGLLGGRWGVLALMLVLLSAERLAGLISGAHGVALGSDAGAPLLLVTSGTVAMTVAVYAWCIHALPRGVRAHFVSAAGIFAAGMILCQFAPAVTPRDPQHQRVVHMLMMSAGRLLELAGIALFLEAVVMYLRSQVRELRFVVDSQHAPLLDSRVEDSALTIRLSAGRVRSLLTGSTIVLLAASLAAALARDLAGWQIEGLYRMFVVDFEGNVPSWYSSLLLLACAAWLAGIAHARHDAGDRQWRQWGMLGLLFVALSADEAAALHELSVVPLRAMLDGNPWLRYPLILPGSVAAVLIYAFFARFFRSLPPATRRGLSRGGAVILFGALGIETVGGWFDPEVHGPTLTYILLSTLEEACEMAGTIVILNTLMRHVEVNERGIGLRGL